MSTCDVCYVNEQGTLICDSGVRALDATLRAAFASALPGTSSAKVDLIVKLAVEVQSATIDDTCVALRSDDAVGAVKVALAPANPVMVLFRYVALPGNILAAYYVQQNNFPGAYGALDHWHTVKPGC